MSIEENFKLSAMLVKTLPKRPTDDELLVLYSLYKQSTCGDCNTPEPGIFSIQDKAKWNAWRKLIGVEESTAMQKYCQVVQMLIKKYR